MIEILLKGLVLVLILMGAAAYMTWCERVLMARFQMRLGPNRVGPFGLLQPIADGIKLLCKEQFQPANIDIFAYWLAPFISLFTALAVFALIPFGEPFNFFGYEISPWIYNANAGFLLILALSSLAVYGIVLSGWASNNRYSLLGSLRSTAQLISYEIPMSMSLLTVALIAETLSLKSIVDAQKDYWFIWTNPVSFIIYVITAFAETNRAPFDLPESEQELTGGYHTEYGGIKFSMFFLAEYVNILAVSAIAVTLFLGGWHGPFEIPFLWFFLKMAAFVFFFIWVRSTMARLRYNQLIKFGWKVLIPAAMINLIITAFFTLVVR